MLTFLLQAFITLRKHGGLILSLFSMMISTGLPELSSEKDLNYLRETLVSFTHKFIDSADSSITFFFLGSRLVRGRSASALPIKVRRGAAELVENFAQLGIAQLQQKQQQVTVVRLLHRHETPESSCQRRIKESRCRTS